MADARGTTLGDALRDRRRQVRLSLRDLAEITGVSANTLSRVERGLMPDLANYERIVEWLDVPVGSYLSSDPTGAAVRTPEIISKHLFADDDLTPEAAARIASAVAQMYETLTSASQPRLAVHMRSAKMFTPDAGEALAGMLTKMQAALRSDSHDVG